MKEKRKYTRRPKDPTSATAGKESSSKKKMMKPQANAFTPSVTKSSQTKKMKKKNSFTDPKIRREREVMSLLNMDFGPGKSPFQASLYSKNYCDLFQ